MASRTYPSDPAEAGLKLFLRWFGAAYARSTSVAKFESDGGVLSTTVIVGRRWSLATAVVNTLAPDADLAFEAARAAVEKRLDAEGTSIALWVPRGAEIPSAEPGLSQLALSVESANKIEDGRLEVRRPANLYLRRNATTGSVVTVLGGLSAQWAAFTNRVPGSYYLNSAELFRLPASTEERDSLIEGIVNAAGQPTADESQTIRTEDVWTANDLEDGGSFVLGTPKPENDEWSSSLRRNLRAQLKQSTGTLGTVADAKALVVLGASMYAEEEKLSWALRGMDPSLYGPYDMIVVIADGLVRPLLRPGRAALPWDE